MKAQQCANAAEMAVTRDREDCQAFVEQTVKRPGRPHSFQDATQGGVA